MLPKENRLRSREDFDRVFQSGQAFFLDEILCLRLSEPGDTVRIGISFKGKKFPRASVRHFYKRKMLAALRPRLVEFPKGVTIVILFQKPFLQPTFEQFEKKVRAIQQYFVKKKI